MLFCQRNTLFLQNVNILIYLNSSLQTRPPLFLSSSPPLFCNLSFSPAQCPAAPRCPLSLWELVMSVLTLTNTGCPDRLALLLSIYCSIYCLSLALSLPHVSTVPMQKKKKSLPSQTLKTRHTSPCTRWRDAESMLWNKMTNQALQTKDDQPLFLSLARTCAALSFFPSPSFLLQFG